MRKWQYNGTLPPVDRREVLRYAGVRGEEPPELSKLLTACIEESKESFTPRMTGYILTREELYARIDGARESKGLAQTLGSCQEVLLFAATVGLAIDRQILRSAAVAPSKALLLQALGTERIEALCDGLCLQFSQEFGECTGRFSAGYGDFPLTAQRSIFALLDCGKIGLTLTEGLLMSPTKSVTAIVGIEKGKR